MWPALLGLADNAHGIDFSKCAVHAFLFSSTAPSINEVERSMSPPVYKTRHCHHTNAKSLHGCGPCVARPVFYGLRREISPGKLRICMHLLPLSDILLHLLSILLHVRRLIPASYTIVLAVLAGKLCKEAFDRRLFTRRHLCLSCPSS